jgi:hypothetical protein
MWTRSGFYCLWLVVMACGADDTDVKERARPTQCEQLRDHLVEVNLDGAQSIDKSRYKAAMKRSLGDDFIAQCERMPAAQRECALDAQDSTAVAVCSATTHVLPKN